MKTSGGKRAGEVKKKKKKKKKRGEKKRGEDGEEEKVDKKARLGSDGQRGHWEHLENF